MRLINTETLEFEEFLNRRTPKYAILSHRWIGEEVSFQDFHEPGVRKSSKFAKIRNCCNFARHEDQIEWVWIDTCCIDKKSSAELSEAINSMYNWYTGAKVCYVYLADVLLIENEQGDWTQQSREDFHRSEWFKRGWTLQELLAPYRVLYLDRHWCIIGTSGRHTAAGGGDLRILTVDISKASGINTPDLFQPRSASVAKKMSWLSTRETSRDEDMAYCMLGLCDVNMPLLYGEGRRAFMRLQLEIIKTSDDESIFAWFRKQSHLGNDKDFGILAQSPEDFARSGEVVQHPPMRNKMPFSVTNKGLQYQVPYPEHHRFVEHSRRERYLLLLDCGLAKERVDDQTKSICIKLYFTGTKWYRKGNSEIVVADKKGWNDIVEKPCTFETLYIAMSSAAR